MTSKNLVTCEISGLRSAFKPKNVSFEFNATNHVLSIGEVGPEGITSVASDLVAIGSAIYRIERLMSFSGTNAPSRFVLSMPIRNPGKWNETAVKNLRNILYLLGGVEWDIDLHGGLLPASVQHHTNDKLRSDQEELSFRQNVSQVALFSGGLDSTCGLTWLRRDANMTALTSFYVTHQKNRQKEIARILSFAAPLQWTIHWESGQERNRTFLYRSFLFLCFAAATANSWGATRIYQFENGVLASAIPPSRAWSMTKHAHPLFHEACQDLFSAILGGKWEVKNPFALFTKRECCRNAERLIGESLFKQATEKTDTCWFHWANHYHGKKKHPGIACGVCIPCIVRQTALHPEDKRNELYSWDLVDDKIKNHKQLGVSYGAYSTFFSQVAATKQSSGDFYHLLNAQGRSLIQPVGPLPLNDLHQMFLRFAKEFQETF